MKIGIYGGSFNPVHYGHLNIARRAVEELKLDRLIVVPAGKSPFKAEVDQSLEVLDREYELKFLAGAFAQVEKTVVDLREIERGGISYAIDTVREIAAENAGAELYFIIGEDSLEGLPRWKDIDELKKFCVFKTYPRTKESSTAIREAFKARKVRLNDDKRTVELVRDGLVRRGGYCPCRVQKLPEYFCPCEEFQTQLADRDFHGHCHCQLYRIGD